MRHKQGNIVKWFIDWQNGDKYESDVILDEYVGETLPFCLIDSNHGLSNNIYYVGEKWKARRIVNGEVTEHTVLVTLRTFYKVGIGKEDMAIEENRYTSIDNFQALPINTYEWTVRVDDSETNGQQF